MMFNEHEVNIPHEQLLIEIGKELREHFNGLIKQVPEHSGLTFHAFYAMVEAALHHAMLDHEPASALKAVAANRPEALELCAVRCLAEGTLGPDGIKAAVQEVSEGGSDDVTEH